MKITKDLKQNKDILIYKVLDNDGKEVDKFYLKNYSYKKKLEMFFFKKLVSLLQDYASRCAYNPQGFESFVKGLTGVCFENGEVVLKNDNNLIDICYTLDIKLFFELFSNLENKISVRQTKKSLEILLLRDINTLPGELVKKIRDFEKENGLTDVFKEILFLALEGHYELGLVNAQKFESQMKVISEIAEEYGATTPDEE